ncbi:MAG: type IV secretion system DNA-binding domain-containing protein, partial [Chloroflexota bacterium]|nr:type IV secretion system DNA-binding domain-containing protein [Chloroflexota bacterium]
MGNKQGRKMIVLGVSTDETGREWQIGIPMKDLTTHTFMFGTTGSGKSTALKNIAIQGFALGASTLILEPHGDLCLDTLASLPNNALSKVVYLSLDSAQPPSIPLMTFGLGGGIDVGVSAVMGVLRMAEPAAWQQATQMREVLRHSIRVILDAQRWNASLLSLDRFLTPGEEAFQEALLDQTSEENFKSRDYCQANILPAVAGEKGTAGMLNSIKAAQRRMEVFVNDRRLRRTLAVPPLGPRINLTELLTGGRMVLAPVNKSEIGARIAPLVSMLFMQMVQASFLSRTDRSDRQQAVLIIDEFAAMAGGKDGGAVVANITNTLLAEARKFGASLVLATQSAAQLPSDVRTEVQINTNHKIILLVSDPEEAKAATQIL